MTRVLLIFQVYFWNYLLKMKIMYISDWKNKQISDQVEQN